MNAYTFYYRSKQLTPCLSWCQSLSKQQSFQDLHPLMTMWSKEQLSLTNRQRRQIGCWLELERRQLPASRSLKRIIILLRRGRVIFQICKLGIYDEQHKSSCHPFLSRFPSPLPFLTYPFFGGVWGCRTCSTLI